MNSIPALRTYLDQKKGERRQIVKQIETVESTIVELKDKLDHIDEARSILQTVAQATQQELEYKVSEIATLALAAVFPDPYKLHLDFELRRNKSEADITFSKGDETKRLKPGFGTGLGPVDIAAFGLRISLMNLKNPPLRKVIILDEPFRMLSNDLQNRASALLKQISAKLGLQLIIVTHEVDLEDSADKVFQVRQVKRISKVTEA